MERKKTKKINKSSSIELIILKKFIRNKLALISFAVIVIAILIAILGYLITPDKTPFCNEQFLELTTKKPGFKVKMLLVKKNEKVKKPNLLTKILWGEQNQYYQIPINSFEFENNIISVEEYNDVKGDVKIIKNINLADALFSLSLTKPVSYNNNEITFYDIDNNKHVETIEKLKKEILLNNIKESKFILGTDRFGRDLLSRLLLGTRVSISVGFISILISLIIGITLGAIAGYYRGFVDDVIMWIINVIWSIPTLLLVIAITMALGKGFWQIFIAVGLTMWVEVARVVRGQVMSLKEKEFIEAGKALGYSNSRIIRKHIIPNVLSPVIVISAANFASAILIEAGLSFLGIGVQPPVPSWGTMIKEHYGYIIVDLAYLAIIPGLAIMLLVLAFTIVGNSLRDVLDARQV
ncbi:MAG: ABC transporter permease [Bacteroidales bacterium]|nr:ABC transporter permease [Bacteroidales bacterium]